ncbi:hypothetical protein AMJ44_06290 [candidate division WOR-1 bacterium DG_54_3]|uniref:Uncharacterized protein n=1 Tax=candidate division WOR-1 bacterium DG_54_3 TaxID=1703775 RepID=A0A0S7Y2S7_UNCSA|nr:MAG: hypothetical protein AMJ44_06290 [candidate division WOR-1 bacterium DG_54_3]
MSENAISSIISRKFDRVDVTVNGKKNCVEFDFFGKALRNRFKDLMAFHSDQELGSMKEEIKGIIEEHAPPSDHPSRPAPMKIHYSPNLTEAEREEAQRLLLSEQNILQQIFFESRMAARNG